MKSFVYGSDHMKIFMKRRKWMTKLNQKYSLVLWWIKSNEPIPSPEEGKRRLQLLNDNGPTNQAFPVNKLFYPPDYNNTQYKRSKI